MSIEKPVLGEKVRAVDIGRKGRGHVYWNVCIECNKGRWLTKNRSIGAPDLCHKCAITTAYRKRNDIGNWKGGYTDHNGYVMVKLKRDNFFISMADANRYVREHRLVMARHLNRRLLPWEIVHHKNGIKTDNRIENLQLISAGYLHISDTQLKVAAKKLYKENEILKKSVYDLIGDVRHLQYEMVLNRIHYQANLKNMALIDRK